MGQLLDGPPRLRGADQLQGQDAARGLQPFGRGGRLPQLAGRALDAAAGLQRRGLLQGGLQGRAGERPVPLQRPGGRLPLGEATRQGLDVTLDCGGLGDVLDGQPVDVLFSLVCPTTRSHLQLLSRLSSAVHDAKFKDVVKRQGTRDEILQEARRVEASLTAPVAKEG